MRTRKPLVSPLFRLPELGQNAVSGIATFKGVSSPRFSSAACRPFIASAPASGSWCAPARSCAQVSVLPLREREREERRTHTGARPRAHRRLPGVRAIASYSSASARTLDASRTRRSTTFGSTSHWSSSAVSAFADEQAERRPSPFRPRRAAPRLTPWPRGCGSASRARSRAARRCPRGLPRSALERFG